MELGALYSSAARFADALTQVEHFSG